MAKKVDMTKLTQRQRRKARDVEEDLKNKGVPPRQAETQAWEGASNYPGGGKRRRGYGDNNGKTNSAQRGVNRKTRAFKTPEGKSKTR